MHQINHLPPERMTPEQRSAELLRRYRAVKLRFAI